MVLRSHIYRASLEQIMWYKQKNKNVCQKTKRVWRSSIGHNFDIQTVREKGHTIRKKNVCVIILTHTNYFWVVCFLWKMICLNELFAMTRSITRVWIILQCVWSFTHSFVSATHVKAYDFVLKIVWSTPHNWVNGSVCYGDNHHGFVLRIKCDVTWSACKNNLLCLKQQHICILKTSLYISLHNWTNKHPLHI